MRRLRMLRFAAISWLPLFSLGVGAQAQTYNAATDWLSTFPTTASVSAATTATWGVGNAWSAGEPSYNWTNQPAAKGNSSLQSVPTFYFAQHRLPHERHQRRHPDWNLYLHGAVSGVSV